MQVQSGINQVRHKFIIYANLQGHPSRSPVKVKVQGQSSKFDLDLDTLCTVPDTYCLDERVSK